MANRFPLIVDTSDSNKIKELPSGDNLQLSGNNIIGVTSITGSGTLTIETVSATNITKNGTPLAAIATSGSYNDLSDVPTNISTFTNDSNYLTNGSNISLLANDAEYLTTVAFDDLTSTPTTLAGYGITDAIVVPGTNVSVLHNDAGYITLSQVQSGDITIDVNNTGDLIGSVFGQDSTILVDGVLSAINTDGTIRSHTTPFIGDTYDLGSFTNRFRDAYINGQVKTTNIYSQDDADLTIAGAAIDGITDGNDIVIIAGANTGSGNGGNVLINAGASSGGSPGEVRIGETNASSVGIRNSNVVIGKASGITNIYGDIVFREEVNFSNATNIVGFTGDVTGSIFADDSTLLVDGVNGQIVGSVNTGVVNADIFGANTVGSFINLGANASSVNVTTDINMLTNDITNVGNIEGYVKIADLKTALQDGAGDYAAFKAWVLANL